MDVKLILFVKKMEQKPYNKWWKDYFYIERARQLEESHLMQPQLINPQKISIRWCTDDFYMKKFKPTPLDVIVDKKQVESAKKFLKSICNKKNG